MSVADQTPANTTILFQYVYSICPRLGCHVILEDTGSERLVNSYVHDNQNIKTTKELADFLGKEIDNTVVTVLPKGIICVRDLSIVNDRTYPLNQVVSVDYSGGLYGLADAVGNKLEGHVRSGRGGAIGMDGHYDSTTQVSLSVKNQTVRSVLTDHLPVTPYRAILWETETWIVRGKEVTTVFFWVPYP